MSATYSYNPENLKEKGKDLMSLEILWLKAEEKLVHWLMKSTKL